MESIGTWSCESLESKPGIKKRQDRVPGLRQTLPHRLLGQGMCQVVS